MFIEFAFVCKQQKIPFAASKEEVAVMLFLLPLKKPQTNKKNPVLKTNSCTTGF